LPPAGSAPLTVSFQRTVKGGPPPVSIHWDFGDGEVANSHNPLHIYTSPGTYIVTLTVTYKEGIFREAMRQILIKPSKEQEPRPQTNSSR
ncbi:MAG: PKD domain-containing protein, partial [Desulfobulbaceae bacterium]|nr:PKD domain-containing protein [Desulfobulbaceae bacterium]